MMIKYMCLNQTHNTNIFPAKNGILDYLSPHTIITGKTTDYNKACQVAFGAYVQGFNVSRNDQTPRTFDGIYLRPSKNKQGGHEVLDIVTEKVVNTPKVKEVPITDLIISAVDKLTEKDGIKILKIANRNNEVLVTATNIAGVDLDDADDPPNDDAEDDDYVEEDETQEEEDVDDEELYDRIDPAELEELMDEDDDDYEITRANVDRSDPEMIEGQRHGDGASVTDSATRFVNSNNSK